VGSVRQSRYAPLRLSYSTTKLNVMGFDALTLGYGNQDGDGA
jgi:hypothetical protein